MKFLCLHGAGTSNHIFKMQTAALRYELGDRHSYEFVQGTTPMDLPPELAPISSPDAEHYAYYDSATSFMTALSQLDAYIEAEGPFEAVLAFSHGASLAAAYLMCKHYDNPSATPAFRCAVLVSPISAYDTVAYLEKGEIRVLANGDEKGPPIAIPTVLMWGETDERKGESQSYRTLCDQRLLEVYAHDGGHEVPGFGTKTSVQGAVKAMRRGISRAVLGTA